MTDLFHSPEFAPNGADAGRSSGSLGLYRVLQYKSAGRRVPKAIYFRGCDLPLGLNPDPPPMPAHEVTDPLSLSRMAAMVSAAGRISQHARRRSTMHSVAALVNGRLVAGASVRRGGARQAAVSDFNLRRIVGEVGCVLDNAARTQGARLSLTVNHDVPARLQGDANVVRQVLFEIASLAIRCAGLGTVAIRVSGERRGGGEIRVHFSVKTADAPARGQHGRAAGGVRPARGTPEVCKQLLGQVGGEFGAREQSDEGPLFWFTIPCREVREDNPEAARGDAAA